ncbi:MAG: tRNA pseudouridine(55) synthase TruB [Deltaproteobacteria bacterium]|nr:MAG: tRNA pseudouridine(55) synthase TruB [Deltaproteobacteria bacterium]
MTAAFLVIDKPAGITSHDVVAAVRAVTGIKKVGHTGTLDPFATGVLPLALGPATRLIEFLDEGLKVYDATVQLGSATDTGDFTGEVVAEVPVPDLDDDRIDEVLEQFLGEQGQRPPMYSAIKVKGKPLYKYARKGEIIEVAERRITVYDLAVVERAEGMLRLNIRCSRGTYARVLADDIATALGTRGHLTALERPRSGPFFLEDALSMPALAELVAPGSGRPWEDVLLTRRKGGERVAWRPRDEVRAGLAPWLKSPLEALSHLPMVDVTESVAKRIRSGGAPPPPPRAVEGGGRFVAALGDELVAVFERSERGVRSLKVIPPAE